MVQRVMTLGTALAATVLMALAVSATAQESAPSVDVDPSAGAPGTVVELFGDGWIDSPPEDVTATFRDGPLELTQISIRGGALRAVTAIPDAAFEGPGSIELCAGADEFVACDTADFLVLPEEVSSPDVVEPFETIAPTVPATVGPIETSAPSPATADTPARADADGPEGDEPAGVEPSDDGNWLLPATITSAVALGVLVLWRRLRRGPARAPADPPRSPPPSRPPSVPPSPAPSVPASPREPPWASPTPVQTWPRLRVPRRVVSSQPFTAELRLESPDGDPASWRPDQLSVQLAADGLDAVDDTRFDLAVGQGRAGTHSFTLVPDEVASLQPRRMVAYLSWEGHLVGWTQADLDVVPAGGTPDGTVAPASAVPLGTPDGPPPDLTVMVSRGDDERFLLWGLDSPHPVDLPTHEVRCDLRKESARAFAHDEVLSLADTDAALVHMQLVGIAAQIGGRIPLEVWESLRRVWPFARSAGRRPVVLLVSEETYIPWELAALPADLVADHDALALLGSQTSLGRWMPPDAADGLEPGHPRLPPSSDVELAELVVVAHDVQDGAPSALPYARAEAARLQERFGARVVPATTDAVAALLEERTIGAGHHAAPDALHLACHGTVDPDRPSRSGIVLRAASGSWVRLSPAMLRGAPLLPHRRPLLFVNACEAGTPQEALDGFGGIVGAALKSGVRGIVAPLWRVEDRAAHDVAHDYYESVLGRSLPAGEALRQVRTHAGDDRVVERTFLAYVYFGHPFLRVARGRDTGSRTPGRLG